MESLPSIVPSERNNGKWLGTAPKHRTFGQYLHDGRKNGVVMEVVPNGYISISTYEDDVPNGLSVVWSEDGFKAELYCKGQLMAGTHDITAWNELASNSKITASDFNELSVTNMLAMKPSGTRSESISRWQSTNRLPASKFRSI